MTEQAAVFGVAEQRIRARLRATPGSQLCNAPGCYVITQGGQLGAERHRAIVHPDLYWPDS